MAVTTSSYDAAVRAAARFSTGLDLSALMMAIQLDRGAAIEGIVETQMKAMNERNDWLKNANAALAKLRSLRPTNTNDTVDLIAETGDPKTPVVFFVDAKGGTQSVIGFMNQNGIPVGPGHAAANQGKFDDLINNLKSALDSVSNQSQRDQVSLQDFMTKLQQTYELTSNILSKMAKLLDSINGNIRG